LHSISLPNGAIWVNADSSALAADALEETFAR
jgi:hypothetical protein